VIDDNLKCALDLASDCQAAYRAATPALRRQLNQAFFKAIYIDDDDLIRSELAAPFDVLLSDEVQSAAQKAQQTSPSYPQHLRSVREGAFNKRAPAAEDSEGAGETEATKGLGLKEPALVGAPGIEPGTSRV
jgi:site-specific DNA recombinase